MSNNKHEIDTWEIEIQTTFNDDDINALIEDCEVDNHEDKKNKTEE